MKIKFFVAFAVISAMVCSCSKGSPEDSPGGQEVVETSIIVNGHEAVDLGLSVKWATCNIGATKPQEYGDYFAWGETVSKSDYRWKTYKWCKGGSETNLTKYNTSSKLGAVDNKILLDSEDDVASVKWKGGWRMPTYEEFNELKSKCTSTWTDDYNGTGVSGRVFTSRLSGYESRSIFLPVAGCYMYGVSKDSEGKRGYYWSSSLYIDNSRAPWFFYFIQSSSPSLVAAQGRCCGFSVRPVIK